MKVLIINSVYRVLSTGRLCADIAAELERRGHECVIAHGRGPAIPPSARKHTYRIGSRRDILAHALRARATDRAGFYSRKATERLIEWIRVYDPDVVHLHTLHGYYLHVGALFEYLKESGKPVVWTLHDCWPMTGHCATLPVAGCDRRKTGCFSCPQRTDYPATYGPDRSAENYARKKALFTGLPNAVVVSPSAWLAGIARESFLKDYEIRVIPNGINLGVFRPTESDFRDRYGLGNRKIILGAAYSWERRKGLADFVRLSELIDEKISKQLLRNDCYRIILLGLMPKQIRSLPPGILGLPKTDDPREIAKIYSAADVFFNPTYQDNYPTVNLEAQACGTPVVTYRTGGSVESVPAEAVSEQGDIEGVWKKICSGTLDVVVDRSFDIRNMLSAYLDLYEKRI